MRTPKQTMCGDCSTPIEVFRLCDEGNFCDDCKATRHAVRQKAYYQAHYVPRQRQPKAKVPFTPTARPADDRAFVGWLKAGRTQA